MYSHILVPLDGSEASERAVPHGQSLAQSFSATVHLLKRNYPPRRAWRDLRRGQLGAVGARQGLDRRGPEGPTGPVGTVPGPQVASLLRDAGLSVETAVLEGGAPENIAQYARDKNIDLIVMSTRGRGGVGRLLLGSVTDRVIRSIRLPVPPE